MCPIPPKAGLPPPESERKPRWGRNYNRYAICLVVLLHLILGTSLMVATSRTSAPKREQRRVDVMLVTPTLPEPAIPEPEPEPQNTDPVLTEVPPIPELPPVAIAEKPMTAPPVADTKPAPAPVADAPPPPPPPVAKAADSAPPKLFEECADASDRHMVADVYRLTAGNRSVFDIRRRKPIKRVCLTQLDITPRPFQEGFPGMGSTVEWFGMDIRFTVNIAETSTWELLLLADDGAVLSIDDENVIDNDGIHAPTPVATRIKLEKGLRNFRVRYFQGPGPDLALMLAWKKPGAADYSYVPRNLIGRPPAAMLAPLQAAE
jgi:hypothetical protein